jgi:hypothetical protein
MVCHGAMIRLNRRVAGSRQFEAFFRRFAALIAAPAVRKA